MKHKKGMSKAVACAAVGIICFFFAHRSQELAPGIIDTLASCVLFPFLVVEHAIVQPVHHVYDEWLRKADLDSKYEHLLQERDDLRAALLESQAVQTMYCDSQEVRDFRKQYETFSAVLVRVLARQSGSQGNYFIVEGGTDKGIHKDTAVVYKNCLVGKVAEVYSYMSKVVVISDPHCKVAAYCHQTGTHGIYEGAGWGREGALTHVGHLSEVVEGDTVFSSGEGLIFPKGFAIGTINSYFKNEGDMQYTVTVQLLLDFATLEYCYVLEREMTSKSLDNAQTEHEGFQE